MTDTAISRIRAADAASTHPGYSVWQRVIPLPPESLMWSVGGVYLDQFLIFGDAWAQVVTQFCPPEATVIDIGCGCGRTARFLYNNRWIRRYIGFDVIPENIAWCNRFIAPAWNGQAEFHHYDLYSREYNPEGKLKTSDFRFPCGNAGASLIFAASVFTHLLEPDVAHYLREIGRTLGDRGRALLSIHNEVPAGHRFHGTETRIDIEPAYFLEMARDAGLRELDRLDDLGGQQVFILERAR